MPRRISVVHITPDFEKAYLRLPKRIQKLATRKDQWFRKDAFDPRLRTHKLKGELSPYWAYSVNREYRFSFDSLAPAKPSTMMWAPMKSILNRRDGKPKAKWKG
jgi:hypothetical protein